PHPLAEREALRELGVALAGEAGDDIRGNGDVVAALRADPGDGVGVLRRVVAAAHAPERRVAAALQREVEVTAEPGVVPEPEQARRDVLRLQRGEADARHARAGQYGRYDVRRRRARVAAVGAELGAGEHD